MEQLVYGGGHPDFDRPESYRLMPRDVVTLAIKDHPELSGELEIQPDGTVHLPNTADLVRLRGLTADEAAAAVREAAAVYVKGDCAVRIQTNRARGGYYFVFGEVLQPGRFPMGLEPVRLSDAILAANWEANPARRDLDGDELGPSFPAAAPRGRYVSPAMADLARVMLITPHRSQPARTTHDMRSALLGVTGDDPIVRPGQIIVVPSLDPDRNAALGGILPSTPTAPPRAAGFSGAGSSSRLPPPAPERTVETGSSPLSGTTEAEDNMSAAFTIANETAPPSDQVAWPGNYLPPGAKASRRRSGPRREEGTGGWKMGF
ncbi:MAG: polysaccharide biosynthesis/export family protein [Planctomycetota bacterium]|nr:polysaccharide biosynthesis/export family protein [Planctomycetota bacterium]